MSGVVGLAGDPTDSYYADVLADPVNEALEAGVYGWGDVPNPDTDWTAGVYGEANDGGSGVYGEGTWGVDGWGWTGTLGGGYIGVHGHGWSNGALWPTAPTRIAGVLASCDTGGVALDVRGKSVFSRSGKVSIAKGRYYVDVDLRAKEGLAGTPLCFATLMTYRSGYHVAAVRPNYPSSGKLRIYLNKALTSATYVAYLVIG